MARTLHMNDGTIEQVFGDPKEALQKIIYERLGSDCEDLYTEILEELQENEKACEVRLHITDELWSSVQDTFVELLKLVRKELAHHDR